MRKSLNAVIIAAGSILLSACGATFDYESLRQTDIKGQSFSAELGRAYKEIALYEADQMFDWPDAALFGRKALSAIKGENVEPERLVSWALPEDKLGILAKARQRLVERMKDKAPVKNPRLAATAQASFDCWVEQQEENWQTEHINKCRTGFFTALAGLEEIVVPWGMGKGQVQAPVRQPKIVPVARKSFAPDGPVTSETRTLFFDLDKAELNLRSRAVIRKVVAAYNTGLPVNIVIGGHADSVGRRPYNMALSRRRSEAVRQALIRDGVPIQLILSQAFGEERLAVKSGDGAIEPRNRRVEITIGPAKSL